MYEYRASCLRVVDGDTFHCEVELGLDCYTRLTIRLAHVDAPEMSTPEGKAAKDYVERKLMSGPFTLRTLKDKREKFGRYLGEVILHTGELLNDELVFAGLARRYEGGSRG